MSDVMMQDLTPYLFKRMRGTWFRLVTQMGWSWIGRIRNRDMISPENDDTWAGCKSLYPLATPNAKSLGQFNYVRNHPLLCSLVLIKHPHQMRHRKSRLGKRVHSSRSLKNARAQRGHGYWQQAPNSII
jgi:hypothetical protein